MNKLFSPCTVGEDTLQNRIAIAPMCQYSAQNGEATAWHTMHYGTLAASGAGLLIVEATAVEPQGRISPYDLGLWSDATEKALHSMLGNIKAWSDMPMFVQLAHAGRKAAHSAPWQGNSPLSLEDGGWRCYGPSCLPYDEHTPPPKALDSEGIELVKQAFAQAAQRADRAGFDGIELHAAHGYLLHQFLSPLSNDRTDNYGGTLENRMRLTIEVFACIREAFPSHKPIGVRISATDFAEGGWDIEESIVLSKKLQAHGCAYIHVSGGGLSPAQNIQPCPGYQVRYAAKIKEHISIPTIAVGLITEAEQAETILSSGQADMVALGRGILYNPRWPWHAAAQLGAQVTAPSQYWRSAPHSAKNLFAIENT